MTGAHRRGTPPTRRLLLFARRPLLGRVKTRLVPPLRAAQALALYRAFLADQAARLARMAEHAAVEAWLDGPWERRADDPLADAGLRLRDQGPGDLGERLLRAFRHCHQAGAGATVVFGADCPTLPESLILEAFTALERGADAVCAPASDGGYVLIGMARPYRELLERIPWSSPAVMQVTAERARAAGIDLRTLAGWYDVDDIDALRHLARELRETAGRAAPTTARALAGLDLE